MDWPPGPPFSVGPAALMGAATPLLKPPFFLVERLGISALDGVLVADQLIEKRTPGTRQSRSQRPRYREIKSAYEPVAQHAGDYPRVP